MAFLDRRQLLGPCRTDGRRAHALGKHRQVLSPAADRSEEHIAGRGAKLHEYWETKEVRAQKDAKILSKRLASQPPREVVRAMIGKGQILRTLRGMLRILVLCVKNMRNPLDGFKQGSGVVVFPFWKNHSAYSKNEVERTKWKPRGQLEDCCIV